MGHHVAAARRELRRATRRDVRVAPAGRAGGRVVSLGLPPAPAPPRPRMLFVATAFACAAVAMLFMGMLAAWVNLRDAAGGTTAAWVPKGVSISMVAPNMMLIIMVGASVLVQWAVYAMARDDRRDTAVAV